jgi:hypothetical protein
VTDLRLGDCLGFAGVMMSACIAAAALAHSGIAVDASEACA